MGGWNVVLATLMYAERLKYRQAYLASPKLLWRYKGSHFYYCILIFNISGKHTDHSDYLPMLITG